MLEFELSMQIDSQKIYDCIQNQKFCFSRHKVFYCTRNCYLTSVDKFVINFQMQQYSKLKVQHVSCLHEKSGLVSLMTNSMFLQNTSFYTQVGRNVNIPNICLTLTKDNNDKCGPYFGKGPLYILQCRHGSVWATGNSSYSDPLLNLYKLSFVPLMILDSHFPIRLNGKQIYKNNVCDATQNIAITRQDFSQFHELNKDFLYADDKSKNLTFHSSLVHHTLEKIKHLEPGKIVELTSSNMFIFYSVLIICAIILALMICFCPGVVFCILS